MFDTPPRLKCNGLMDGRTKEFISLDTYLYFDCDNNISIKKKVDNHFNVLPHRER